MLEHGDPAAGLAGGELVGADHFCTQLAVWQALAASLCRLWGCGRSLALTKSALCGQPPCSCFTLSHITALNPLSCSFLRLNLTPTHLFTPPKISSARLHIPLPHLNAHIAHISFLVDMAVGQECVIGNPVLGEKRVSDGDIR